MSRTPHVHLPTPRSLWTEGAVYGLGDPLSDARVLDRPLQEWRTAQQIVPAPVGTLTGPAIIVGDDIWISNRMLRDFQRVAAAASANSPVRLMRPDDGPGRYADPLSRLPRANSKILFDVWYLPPGCLVDLDNSGVLAEILEHADVGVDVVAKTFEVNAKVDPEATGVSQQSFAVSPVAVAPIAHWVELHRANLLALGTHMLEPGAFRGALTVLWAIVRAMSLNPFKILGKLNRRGRGCRIHPRAVVEGCTLGDRVKVDAGAVLRGCFIGDDVEIGANTIAEFSIIGARARLTRMAMSNLSVLYPDSSMGGIIQLGMVGHHTTTKLYSVATDMTIDKAVRVQTPDGLKDVDSGYQGVCIGHRVFIASGVWIAPGRMIASERRLLRAPESIVTR